jgi:hypothetical protein
VILVGNCMPPGLSESGRSRYFAAVQQLRRFGRAPHVIPEEGEGSGEGMIGRSSRAGAPAFARGLGMRQRRSSGCGQPDRQNIAGREAPTLCRLLLEDSGALHSVWAMLRKTMKPSFPKQFHSSLILLESRACHGSAWPAQASDSAQVFSLARGKQSQGHKPEIFGAGSRGQTAVHFIYRAKYLSLGPRADRE